MTLPDVSTLGTIGIGAAFAALAAGWQQVRGLLGRITGIAVVTVEVYGEAASAVQKHIRETFTTTPNAFRYFFGQYEFIRPQQRVGIAVWETLGVRGRFYWRGLRPMWCQIKGKEGEEGPGGALMLRYVRGFFDVEKLVFEATSAAGPAYINNSRFHVYRRAGRSGKAMMSVNGATPSVTKSGSVRHDPNRLGRLIGWKAEDVGERSPAENPVERLALTPTVAHVVDEVERWFKSKNWYKARQIAWRLGLLFHGPPGTGKSSLAKALAQKLGIPIYLLDISTMDNDEFHEAYTDALSESPCMVLIEDIDAVFHGRENVVSEKGKGLTFDCLLNTVSGVENSDGVLLVVTTNHLDKVDTALGMAQEGTLSSRPGRIDRTVEMPVLDRDGRVKLAKRILEGCHESWVEHLIDEGENDTGAQFEDRCATTALTLYWSKDPQQPAPWWKDLLIGNVA